MATQTSLMTKIVQGVVRHYVSRSSKAGWVAVLSSFGCRRSSQA